MKTHKLLVLDQKSQEMEQLADKNGTTYGICGFVTCALTRYLAQLEQFDPQILKKINAQMLTPHIEAVMKTILNRRRLELKKFYKIMNDHQRKAYLRDWVANYEIADYLQNVIEDVKNKQVFFFRQSAFDHAKQLADLTYEQKQRVEQEHIFKGHKYFYSSFGPYANHFKQQFEQILKKADKTKPIIIATDVLHHYNTTVLYQGQIYILDSLTSYMDSKYDSHIVECIEYLYKQSYLIKDKP